MSKIIIENRSNKSMIEAINRVQCVIEKGRISQTSKGKQYSFVTSWQDGIAVYADINKKSDKFIIINQESRQGNE